MPIRSWFRQLLLLCSLAICNHAAHAASIAFHLELTGTRLTLRNTGDSIAFFPEVLAMKADGSWQPVSPPLQQRMPTQISPGESLDLGWPDPRPPENLSPIERLRPTMVRFSDQTGVGFGHISLFTTPPTASALTEARYVRGALQISPPKDNAIHATWVLWPQEEGIAGIRGAFKRDVTQPPARRIDWRKDAQSTHFHTGAAQPAALLLHETAQGFQLQRVPSGWNGQKQQISLWLTSSSVFYSLAALFAAAAAFTLSRQWRQRAVVK